MSIVRGPGRRVPCVLVDLSRALQLVFPKEKKCDLLMLIYCFQNISSGDHLQKQINKKFNSINLKENSCNK